jgi:hypothetical protein
MAECRKGLHTGQNTSVASSLTVNTRLNSGGYLPRVHVILCKCCTWMAKQPGLKLPKPLTGFSTTPLSPTMLDNLEVPEPHTADPTKSDIFTGKNGDFSEFHALPKRRSRSDAISPCNPSSNFPQSVVSFTLPWPDLYPLPPDAKLIEEIEELARSQPDYLQESDHYCDLEAHQIKETEESDCPYLRAAHSIQRIKYEVWDSRVRRESQKKLEIELEDLKLANALLAKELADVKEKTFKKLQAKDDEIEHILRKVAYRTILISKGLHNIKIGMQTMSAKKHHNHGTRAANETNFTIWLSPQVHKLKDLQNGWSNGYAANDLMNATVEAKLKATKKEIVSNLEAQLPFQEFHLHSMTLEQESKVWSLNTAWSNFQEIHEALWFAACNLDIPLSVEDVTEEEVVDDKVRKGHVRTDSGYGHGLADGNVEDEEAKVSAFEDS